MWVWLVVANIIPGTGQPPGVKGILRPAGLSTLPGKDPSKIATKGEEASAAIIATTV
jgi:hypothetical protein